MAKMRNQTFTIYADGGALNNGKENVKCYGSYAIESKGEIVKRERFNLPHCSTSNQAEFATFSLACAYLQGFAARLRESEQAIGPKNTYIDIRVDSRLVAEYINGTMRVKDLDLRDFARDAMTQYKSMAGQFRKVQVVWTDDLNIKRILGH